MHTQEIALFSNGISFLRNEFYIDALETFRTFDKTYPKSDLADDALYNCGLIYFYLNNFNDAIDCFNKVIMDFPEGEICVWEDGREYGKTTAKAYYSLINCYLAIGDTDHVYSCLEKLGGYEDSYVVGEDGSKQTYEQMAKHAIEVYNNVVNTK